MMIEDRLNTTQRIRLEALSQAIMASMHPTGTADNAAVLAKAREYERWIAKGKIPGESDDLTGTDPRGK